MTITGLPKIILRFEEFGSLEVVSEHGHKTAQQTQAKQLLLPCINPTAGLSSVRIISKQMDMPYFTV